MAAYTDPMLPAWMKCASAFSDLTDEQTEAICQFAAAHRSALAAELLKVVEAVPVYTANGDGTNRYPAGWAIKQDIEAAIRARLAELGIEAK